MLNVDLKPPFKFAEFGPEFEAKFMVLYFQRPHQSSSG